jgi:MoaA/NifB/PqqE/SkfB family radical SAM enzyme
MWAELYNTSYSGVQNRLRTFANGCLAGRCRPVSPMIQLTARCNARCVHCDIWKNNGGEASPNVEQWKGVLREIRDWLGPVHIVITGGEALLRPYATALVDYASDIGLLPELLTHGYWIDQTRIEDLARAEPWRITMSLDAVGPAHSKIRGREDFFERSYSSLQTLVRIREKESLHFSIRLKTVIMEQNLDHARETAQLAANIGADVFYQPIEQNYNTVEDPEWYKNSPNWPKDLAKAIGAVEELITLKTRGMPIANSVSQLEAMIDYFNDPEGLRMQMQNHSAHEKQPICSSLTELEIRATGDVHICARKPPIGNIKDHPLRQIWKNRPRYWIAGCCLLNDVASAE